MAIQYTRALGRQMMTVERYTSHYIGDTSTRPKNRYEYFVTGSGIFPFDMLRYDSCWPQGVDDAAKLHDDPLNHKLRSIKMNSYKPPTIDRWASFVWSVGLENLS